MEPATITLAMCALLTADDPAPAVASTPVTATATLVVESTELAKMRSIPILDSRKLEFTISSFAGCQAEAKQPPALKELSHDTLAPKKSSASVQVPGDTDLAVFATYTNASGGNSISCGRALRFHSEAGKTYHVHYIPPRPWHLVSCGMTIVESQDGKELPVPSAHDALLKNNGFWKGSELDICAGGEPPQDKPAS